ncbi:hypothetical protein [Halomonas halodenitrificans]|uniref:hypothetical protein n=1 Tax=Halomonas halodenitrificans TaxID=28252 RepID=UPI0004877A33|nr:hypothetical protein [Halomonas halodenitrificans]
MCGRFALYSPYPKFSQALRLPLEPEELTPRYNVVILPAALLTHRPVSTRVNKPTNDDAGLIEMQFN